MSCPLKYLNYAISLAIENNTGILAFCSRALPAGRTFSRTLYMATAKASKPYHYIRVSRKMFDDLMVWKLLSDFVDIEFRMETTAILST
jgi:hypothetical protein